MPSRHRGGLFQACRDDDQSVSGCHKKRNAGKIPGATDCNVAASADIKGKIAAAAQKLRDAVASSCTGQEAQLLTDDYYLHCPVRCDGAVINPIDSMTELADCLACNGAALVFDTTTETVNLPNPAILSSSDRKCRDTIAKSYGQYAGTLAGGRFACQQMEDENGNNTLTPCSTADPKNKGAVVLAKAEAAVTSACAAADLGNVASCDESLEGLVNCLEQEYSTLSREAFTAAFELPEQPCPSGIRMVCAGVYCVPPGTGAGRNAAMGLPGPGATRMDMLVERRYD